MFIRIFVLNKTILRISVRILRYHFTFVKKVIAYAIHRTKFTEFLKWTKWLKKLSVFKIINQFLECTDRKNVTNQTYSCPRDWRLSASWVTKLSPIETPRTSQHYRIEGFKGALNWAPIMPRDDSLSDSQYNFFSSIGSTDLILRCFKLF